MAKSQLQYRCRENPQSTWEFNSLVEPEQGLAQIRNYYGQNRDRQAVPIFEYRLVEPESKEWLSRPVVEQTGSTCYAVPK